MIRQCSQLVDRLTFTAAPHSWTTGRQVSGTMGSSMRMMGESKIWWQAAHRSPPSSNGSFVRSKQEQSRSSLLPGNKQQLWRVWPPGRTINNIEWASARVASVFQLPLCLVEEEPTGSTRNFHQVLERSHLVCPASGQSSPRPSQPAISCTASSIHRHQAQTACCLNHL